MIRRSKRRLTAAAMSSSPSSCSSSAINDDGNETKNSNNNITFASEHHASDNHHTHGSTFKSRLHQRYARWRSFSPLHRQTKKSAARTTPPKERKHLTTKSITKTRCFIIITILLLTYQLDAYIREYQGPFDQVSTTILKPYYGMYCPSFSHYLDDAVESSSNGHNNDSEIITSWDCNTILGGHMKIIINNDGVTQGKSVQSSTTTTERQQHASATTFPRIFMIGARDEALDTFQSWQSKLHNAAIPSHNVDGNEVSSQPYLKRINTLGVSNQFATSGGALRSTSLRLATTTTATNTTTTMYQSSTSNHHHHHKQHQQFLCRKIKWEQRLFYVYQHIFKHLLITYPNDDGFVIIEDDATLLNPTEFAKEVCSVHRQKIQFYSLYRSPLQQLRQQRLRQWWSSIMGSPKKQQQPPSSCIYQHGTVAFYIRRQFMEQIVNEHRRNFFCRFPIDMYISKFGPWYATRDDVVGHLGLSRIGSSA